MKQATAISERGKAISQSNELGYIRDSSAAKMPKHTRFQQNDDDDSWIDHLLN